MPSKLTAAFLRYLLVGSDELVMPKSWLANTARLKAYETDTWHQLQGQVVKDVAATQREQFWAQLAEREAKRATTLAAVKRFPQKVG